MNLDLRRLSARRRRLGACRRRLDIGICRVDDSEHLGMPKQAFGRGDERAFGSDRFDSVMRSQRAEETV